MLEIAMAPKADSVIGKLPISHKMLKMLTKFASHGVAIGGKED